MLGFLKWVRTGALTLVWGAWALAAHAGPFSGIVAFGDSLTDSGNDYVITGGAVPTGTYYTDGVHTGRFTNGLNYADVLATSLGVGLAPSRLGGGNYAYGGARTDSIQPGLAALGGQSFNQQLTSFYGSHASADPNALYVLWIGANDMSDAISARLTTGDPNAISQAIGTATLGIGNAIGGLAALGAKHFLVPNLPDLSLTPTVRAYGSQAVSSLAQGASVSFNQVLEGTLAAPAFAGLDLDRLDVFAAQTAVTSNPAAYGFTNVSAACYTGNVDGSPGSGGGAPTVCANPSQYLYWDYEHPTAALHAVLAQQALAAVVPEPQTWALMLAGLAVVVAQRRRRRF